MSTTSVIHSKYQLMQAIVRKLGIKLLYQTTADRSQKHFTSTHSRKLTLQEAIARFPKHPYQRVVSLDEIRDARGRGFEESPYKRVKKRLLKDCIPYFPKKANRVVSLDEIQEAIGQGGKTW